MAGLVPAIHVFMIRSCKTWMPATSLYSGRPSAGPGCAGMTLRWGMSMPRNTADKLAIRELIENWAMWRDARLWDRFRTLWHKDGQMWATWFQGSFEDFIKVSQEGYDRGVRIMHTLGGTTIDIKGKRAIAQTRMAIQQRALVEGVLCDVTCSGKFYDFLEKRRGKWGFVLR